MVSKSSGDVIVNVILAFIGVLSQPAFGTAETNAFGSPFTWNAQHSSHSTIVGTSASTTRSI